MPEPTPDAIDEFIGRWGKCGWMGMGNNPRYNNSRCFDPFPFPALEEGELKTRIREFGERLDAHRKARQAAHPDLTLTGMYNVLEKLRGGDLRSPSPLTDKERKIHDDGLVTVLKQIHDDLDAAVFQAYGWEDLYKERRALWPPDKNGAETDELGLPGGHRARPSLDWEQELLTRLVALNHERAAEERNGHVRWLRPEYQAPEEVKSKDIELPMVVEKRADFISAPPEKLNWPSGLDAQFAGIRKLLPATGPDAPAIAAVFGKKTKARINQIEDILKTLRSLGKAGVRIQINKSTQWQF